MGKYQKKPTLSIKNWDNLWKINLRFSRQRLGMCSNWPTLAITVFLLRPISGQKDVRLRSELRTMLRNSHEMQ
jgi:hypothetical protein